MKEIFFEIIRDGYNDFVIGIKNKKNRKLRNEEIKKIKRKLERILLFYKIKEIDEEEVKTFYYLKFENEDMNIYYFDIPF